MAKIEDIRELINLDTIDFPPEVHVNEMTVKPYVDHMGYDSLSVFLVLEDSTQFPLPAMWRFGLHQQMQDILRSADLDLWPYIRFATEAELAEPVEE